MGTQMCNTYSRGFVCSGNALFYLKYQPILLFYGLPVEYVHAILIYHQLLVLKNLVEFTRSIIFCCIITLTSLVLIRLLWNTMKCVFLIFIDNLLASSHVLTLCNSLFSAMMSPSYSFPSRSTVVSSAKSMENSS